MSATVTDTVAELDRPCGCPPSVATTNSLKLALSSRSSRELVMI